MSAYNRWVATLVGVAVVCGAELSWADPCGMVPPIYPNGQLPPLTRIGEQKTYVFYKDGIETFVIRPGFSGKVDDFGMLIPFPNPPAIRKVPDDIFGHVAAAIDPPEIVVDLTPIPNFGSENGSDDAKTEAPLEYDVEVEEVRVIREEAVGMYEVAVLEAGSPAALKRWMDDHGYKYPDGMDEACQSYVNDKWCFVAVKTRVGSKRGVDPKPGQDSVAPKRPPSSLFDGNVQAMGFRFRSDEFVVPMKLSAFNDGKLSNIIYVLTDSPRRVRSIPEEYVVRQVPGNVLYRNLVSLLPLRIIGGTADDLSENHMKRLDRRRDPMPHNGFAAELFASDLLAVRDGRLSHGHEEREKELLRIGERLYLRGPEIDKLNQAAFTSERQQVVTDALEDLLTMTLTVIDGDFERDTIASENLSFPEYEMPPEANDATVYDAKRMGPVRKQPGIILVAAPPAIPGESPANSATTTTRQFVFLAIAILAFVAVGSAFWLRRRLTSVSDGK